MRPRGFTIRRPVLATALCACVAFAFPLVALHQVVFGGRTMSTALLVPGVNGYQPPTGAPTAEGSDPGYRGDPGASAWQTEPWAELTSRERARGEWPLWNPHQATGKPHAANVISAAFDPLLLAVNEHPTPLTWDLSIVLAFCLGSVAMFAFLRALALRRMSCLVGCVAFSLGGFFVIYSNNPFARAYIYLPILLLLVDRVLVRRTPPWTIALGTALAGSVLVGMAEASFFVVGTAALYGAYRVVTGCRDGDRLRPLGLLALSAVLGVALALPLLVLFLGYEPISYSLHQEGSPVGTLTSPARTLVYWAVPFLNGKPLVGFLPSGGLSGAQAWTGAGVLAAVAICTAAPLRFLTARRAPFFAGLALVSVWKIYGFPGSEEVGRLPVFERLIFAAWMLPVLQLCLAVLAAIGVDAIARGKLVVRRLAVVTVGVVVVGLLALRSSRAVIDAAPSDSTLRWVGLAAGAAVGVLAVAWTVTLRPRWRFPVGLVAGILITIEVFVLFPMGIFERRVDPYQSPRWQAIVARAQSHGSGVDRVMGLDAKLYPDTATALGLYDVRSLDGIYPDRWVDYVRAFVSPIVDRFTGGPYSFAEQEPAYRDNPMFDLMGVRYLLADPAGTDPSANGSQFRRIGTTREANVYENRDALPRTFVVHDVTSVPDERAALALLRSKGTRTGTTTIVDAFDPRASAVVEAQGGERPAVETCASGTQDRAVITEYRPLEVRVRVDAACPGLLVLSDTYTPDWHATVNGEDARVAPTDVLFRGVRVPAGRSTVVFRYESRSFDIALWVARIAALAAIVWLVVWGVRVHRRTRRPVAAVT